MRNDRYFEIGDTVVNVVSGVGGTVNDFYTPQWNVDGEPVEHTTVITDEGYRYSAPSDNWYLATDRHDEDFDELDDVTRSYYKRNLKMEEVY